MWIRFVFDRWFAVAVAAVTVVTLSACDGGPGSGGGAGQNPGAEGRTAKFRSAEEHLSHSRVRSAITNSGHEIHRGDSPPLIGGRSRRGLHPAATVFDSAEYRVVGSVTKTTEAGSGLRGQRIDSRLCLHDQGADGTISMRESTLGISVDATGHITGSGDKFTTFLQSHQDLAAQLRALSNDASDLGVCVADVSIIASGRSACPGCSLEDFRTLTTITSLHCPKMYDLLISAGQSPSEARQRLESVANNWWRTSSTGYYQGSCS